MKFNDDFASSADPVLEHDDDQSNTDKRTQTQFPDQGPVSRKSRNVTGHIRVSQFSLNLKNGEDFKTRQTSR